MDVGEAPTNPIGLKVHQLVCVLGEARADVARLEDQLKRAQARVRDLEEFKIPELLEELGTEIYRLPDGTVVEVKRDVLAGIRVEDRAAAHAWLEANGHGGLIKRSLVVDFDRDEAEAVFEVKRELSRSFDVKIQEAVNPSTLRAWANRRASEGLEIPPSISVEPRSRAVVK